MEIISAINHLDVSTYVYVGLFLFLVVGIIAKDKPKNINDYALGVSPFSKPVLIATMSATLIGGGSTIGDVNLLYSEGFLLIFPGMLGYLGHILFIRYILPKLDRYYDQVSIASILSKIYGISVERLAGIVAYMYCFGAVALQVKVIGIIIQYALGYDSVFATILSFLVITTYSALGGVKSVIRTDVLQFIIFIIVLPTIGSFLLKESGGIYYVFEKTSWKTSDNFNLISYISLFVFGLTPNISPTFIHRLLVGRNKNKNKSAIYLTALIQILCSLFAIIVAAVAMVKFQNIDGQTVLFKTVACTINNSIVHGLFSIAMLAVVLSSADSLMNTGAIIFVENIMKDLVVDNKIKLLTLKIVTILSGFLGLFIALKVEGLLEIIWFVAQYYFAIIFVPFIGGLFVDDPKPSMFWASAISGFMSYTLLKIFIPEIRYLIYVISLAISFLAFIFTNHLTQSKSSGIDKLSNKTKKSIDSIVKEMNVPVGKLGYAIIPLSIFTLIVEILSEYTYVDTTIFNLCAGLISISFIFLDRVFRSYQKTFCNCYVLFSVWYCFPFLSSYLYYTLPNTSIAFANMVISCTLLAIIFSSQTLFFFLMTGAIMGSLVYFILHSIILESFITHFLILASITLYTGVISFFILKVKEDRVKKFILEITQQNSGSLNKESSKILNKYSEVISILKKHDKAKDVYLKKSQFDESKWNYDIISLNVGDLVKTLKDYLSLIELENEIKYQISNKVSEILINTPLPMIYKLIFSLSYYVGYFNERGIKISITHNNNHLFIKYSIPSLKFNIREIKRYINVSNREEGIINFDLVEKIIQNEQNIQLKINSTSLSLQILLVTQSIKSREFINDIMPNNKRYIN